MVGQTQINLLEGIVLVKEAKLFASTRFMCDKSTLSESLAYISLGRCRCH